MANRIGQVQGVLFPLLEVVSQNYHRRELVRALASALRVKTQLDHLTISLVARELFILGQHVDCDSLSERIREAKTFLRGFSRRPIESERQSHDYLLDFKLFDQLL